MKKVKLTGLISLIFIAFIGIFVACKKEDTSKEDKSIKDRFETIELPTFENATITIKAKPHRTIKENKKGKVCDCKACFGICEIEISFDVNMAIALGTTGQNKVKIYMIEDFANAEIEFGIDEEMNIPLELLPPAISRLTLLNGEYSYVANDEIIEVNGVTYQSYGYVIVDAIYN